MTGKAYVELELEIGRGGRQEYSVAARTPSGSTRAVMQFLPDGSTPESLHQDLQTILLRSKAQPQSAPSHLQQEIQQFGARLFDTLFTGDVLALYDACWQQAADEDTLIRIRLSIQTAELAALSWEFLYDSRRQEHLCLSLAAPMVRYLRPPETLSLPIVMPPLRILAIASNPQNWPQIDVKGERQQLESAVKHLRARELVELTWVEGQEWRDVQRAFWAGQWHVLHFVGHASYELTTGEGSLVFGGDGSHGRHVGMNQLGELLAGGQTLRLVMLSSGAGESDAAPNPFDRVAERLVQRGIPNVLAMQHRMDAASERELARAFYGALSAAVPVDLALVYARTAIRSEVPGSIAWGMPALFSHSPQQPIFRQQSVVSMACRHGDEALQHDDFERAIAQFAVAVDMGADASAKEKQALAEKTRQQLLEARESLKTLNVDTRSGGARSGNVRAQIAILIKMIQDLEALQAQLPESLAIQAELDRAQQRARALRDRFWQEGLRHVGDQTPVVASVRRLKQLQEDIQHLERAEQIDFENLAELDRDLEQARLRLDTLQNSRADSQEKRRKGWRIYLLLSAATIIAILALVLMLPTLTGQVPAPREATPSATRTPAQETDRSGAPPVMDSPTVIPTATFTAALPRTVQPQPSATVTLLPTDTPSIPAPTTTVPPPTTPARTLTPTAMETVPPSPIPTQAAPTASPKPPLPTETPQPTATPTAGIIYPAPTLLLPENISLLTQRAGTVYLLQWEWAGTLQEDEWFDIRIWPAGKPHYGIAWTKTTEYNYDICLLGSGDYFWSVAVIRGQAAQWQGDMSPEAIPNRFTSFRYDDWCDAHDRYTIRPTTLP